MRKAAALTAYYSDRRGGDVSVKYGRGSLNKSVTVLTPSREEIEKMRIV
jgi:hypothetical protein